MLARLVSMSIRVILTATLAGSFSDAVVLAQTGFGSLPLSFEANRGQTAREVKFLSRGDGYTVFLTESGAVLSLAAAQGGQRDSIRMELTGADAGVEVAGAEELQGKANYFLGNDPAKWQSNVPMYAKVRYAGVYDGVDLVFYGNRRQLEYDFVVAPDATYSSIQLAFSGQTRLQLAKNGDLIVHGKQGTAALRKPVVYQETNGGRSRIAGGFRLRGKNGAGFWIGHYDHNRPLIIDPVLVYSTYLGGSDDLAAYVDNIYGGNDVGDQANAVAVDSSGNVYVAGMTLSTDFPITKGVVQGTDNDEGNFQPSVFVSKLNSTGTALIYSTYLGGTGSSATTNVIVGDSAAALAVDATGSVYVAGTTYSIDFPVSSGAFQMSDRNPWGNPAGFVTRLDATGSALIYSTYLSGGTFEQANGLAIDSDDNAFVVGLTQSAGFPATKGALQTKLKGSSTGFAAKLNGSGSDLTYATYLGGSGGDVANAVAVDTRGDAYITGSTSSVDFPTTSGAFQHAYAGGGLTNAFAAKLNPSGSGLVYSTYLGGYGFASNSNGMDVVGATIGDIGAAVAIDDDGDAFIAGSTASSNFPVTAGAFQSMDCMNTISSPDLGSGSAPCQRAFVTKINSAGTGLVYSTFLGGNGDAAFILDGSEYGFDLSFEVGDAALGVSVDKAGNAYVAGQAFSTNFPITRGAVQNVTRSGANLAPSAFLSALNPTGSALVYSTYLGGSGIQNSNGDFFGNLYPGLGDSANAIALDNSGNAYIAGGAFSSNFPTSYRAYQTKNHSSYNSNAFVAKLDLSAEVVTSPSVTKLISTANPESSAGALTFTATVAAASGTAIPGGSVLFTVDGTPMATTALTATGKASYANAKLAVGTHTIVASYSGSSAFGVSSASLNEKITEPITPSPTFSLTPGVFTEVKTVTILDAAKGALIYYTTNGEAPSTSSTKYPSAGIKVSATETIKAIAVASGELPSAVASAIYTIHLPLDEPVLSVKAGTYSEPQSLTVTDASPAALLFYTTNGEIPTASSPRYTGPLAVSKTETLKVIALATGYPSSPVVTAVYTIK